MAAWVQQPIRIWYLVLGKKIGFSQRINPVFAKKLLMGGYIFSLLNTTT